MKTNTSILNKFLVACKIFRKKLSFSIIELTIVLFVIGIIVGSGLVAYKATNPKIKNDLKKRQEIEDALQQFFTVNGRLPFPANPKSNKDNAGYLEENGSSVYNASAESRYCSEEQKGDTGNSFPSCSSGEVSSCCPDNFVLWGVVPTRTLGLPDSYAYDSQGHNFEYITHSSLANFNGKKFSTGHKKSSYITDQNGRYVVYFSNETLDPITISINRLSVYNNKIDSEILTTKNNTAYVIISKGQSDKCYFDTKTGEINTSKPTNNTIKNCVQNYGSYSTDSRTIYQGFSKDFDNIVKYKTLSELIQKNSNIKEDTRILTNRNNAVEYQLKVDEKLITTSKEVSGAINELSNSAKQINSLFKIVSTFDGVVGDPLVLYFLTSSYNNYIAGIYIYQDGNFIPLNGAKKNVCELAYPVGSIYISFDSNLTTNDSVKQKLGCGEWERVECGAILQNAGQTNGSYCGDAGSKYISRAFDGTMFYYRDLPVNYAIKAGLPEIIGDMGCVFGSPCKDRSYCETFFGRSFRAHKECGHTAFVGSGSGMETYEYIFNASYFDDVYGGAGRSTVQPFTYTVYMWKRVS